MDSLIVVLETLKSLNPGKDNNFTQPSFDDIIRAKPWKYGNHLFNSILGVGNIIISFLHFQRMCFTSYL